MRSALSVVEQALPHKRVWRRALARIALERRQVVYLDADCRQQFVTVDLLAHDLGAQPLLDERLERGRHVPLAGRHAGDLHEMPAEFLGWIEEEGCWWRSGK